MKRFLKQGAVLLCVFICMAGFSIPAMAYTTIDTSKPTFLTIVYGESKAIPNARFELYRVADVTEQVQYTISGDFKDYPVKLNGLDSAGWKAAAETLKAYAKRDAIKAQYSGITDSRGHLTFSGLEAALYLVVGENLKIGQYTYTPEPMLVLLPSVDENDQWTYDVTAAPKYEEDHQPDSGVITRKVLKVWEDEGHQKKRPKEINVQLLRDGNVYDTVALNEGNHWKHTWKNLEEGYDWQVAETQVPDGYTVSVSREGISFVITNTVNQDISKPTGPGNPKDPALPQTGMLWWPVPLLCFCGLMLFLWGWIRRRNEESYEEET